MTGDENRANCHGALSIVRGATTRVRYNISLPGRSTWRPRRPAGLPPPRRAAGPSPPSSGAGRPNRRPRPSTRGSRTPPESRPSMPGGIAGAARPWLRAIRNGWAGGGAGSSPWSGMRPCSSAPASARRTLTAAWRRSWRGRPLRVGRGRPSGIADGGPGPIKQPDGLAL